jgi:predicted negative regulator of RcsB-dependent stress response
MTWIFKKALPASLARFVEDTNPQNLPLSVNLANHRNNPQGRRLIVESLYKALRAWMPPIQYDLPVYNAEAVEQNVRPPADILGPPYQGTCLDLALLFSGLCMYHRLLPFVIVLENHALAAVSLTHSLEDWNSLSRPERAAGLQSQAVWKDAAWLRTQCADGGAFLPVECTGFARSQVLRGPAGQGRDNEDLLSFERAVAAGREQLAHHRLQFALDLAIARYYYRIRDADETEGPSDLEGFRNSLGHLPPPADLDAFEFVGRARWLKELDEVWEKKQPAIVHIIAAGGVGKSTLVWKWLDSFLARGCPGAHSALDWSFHSQGQHDSAGDSSRKFVALCRAHFKIPSGPENPEVIGRDIAQAFAKVGGIIVLDGLEPLQHKSPDGRVKDDILRAFLQNLSAEVKRTDPGRRWMLIITTRWAVASLGGAGVKKIDLEVLSPKEGAALLRDFHFADEPDKRLHISPKRSPQRFDQELSKVVEEYHGHALALALLASFLLRHKGGDLSQRSVIPALAEGLVEDQLYRQARRIMTSYDEMFQTEGTPIARACRQLLCLVGLFQGPAPVALLHAVRAGKPLGWLTEGLTPKRFDEVRSELQKLRLLNLRRIKKCGLSATIDVIETHPLIREHFGKILDADLKRQAHERIYLGLKNADVILDDQVDQLYRAVEHGCKALRFRGAYELFLHRIIDSNEITATQDFGGVAPLLSLLAHFFEDNDWEQPFRLPHDPAEGLTENEQTLILVLIGEFMATTKAYSAVEVERACVRALKLNEGPQDPTLSFRAQIGLLRFWMMRGKVDDGCQRAEALYTLAKDQLQDSDSIILANRAIATTQFFRGDLSQSQQHAELGIAKGTQTGLLSLEGNGLLKARLRAARYVGEPITSCYGYLALCLWHSGDSKTAEKNSEIAFQRMNTLQDNQTITSCLYLRSMLQYYDRDIGRCRQTAEDLKKVSDQYGQQFFFWFGSLLTCWAEGIAQAASLHETERAAETLTQGINAWNESGADLMLPFWYTLLAELQVKLERNDAALKSTGLGLDLVKVLGCHMFKPELYRIRADVFKASGNDVQAEYHYKQAAATAQNCHSAALESRAIPSKTDL